MDDWQPIETAPKDCAVIAWDGNRIVLANWVELLVEGVDRGYWNAHFDYDGVWEQEPTHWIPVPAAPLSIINRVTPEVNSAIPGILFTQRS